MNDEMDSNARIFAGLRVLAILMAILLPATATSAFERPNVVVLYVDDLGYKDIGCYGGPVKTPALDNLAAGGVRFTDFYSGAAACSPSRATLLTGRHHFRAGIYNVLVFGDEPMYLLDREVTLAEVLKQNGYSTAHFGKWHVGSSKAPQFKLSPEDHGFDYWFGMHSGASPSHKNPVNFLRNGQPVGKIEGYSCQIVVDEAISWLDEKRDPEAPFFLNLWFHEPHDVVAAPDDIVSQYGDLNDQAAVYSGTIDNTDRAIARLLDKLKKVDLPENTLIVYASDNGSYRSDRVGNLRGKKGSNYEGGIRVPGIFSWPGHIVGGRVQSEPAGVVDLLPTVCGLVGIDKPEGVHLDGSDISPLLLGQDDAFARQQALYWHNGRVVALRRGEYSLVAFADFQLPRDEEAIAAVEKKIEDVLREANSPELVPWTTRTSYFYKHFKNMDAERLRLQFIRLNQFQTSWIPTLKSGGYRNFELYDLSTDPGQQNNLAAQLPGVAARLKKEMLDITASVMAEAPDWQPLHIRQSAAL
jgi:arylsulfatase A